MEADWRGRLAAYDDSCLDPVERRLLDDLLDRDPEARAYLAALRRDRERFAAAFGTAQASDMFTGDVMARITARRTPFPLPRVLELAAAAMFVLVVASVARPGQRIAHAQQLACQQSLKDLGRVVLSYTEDYDGRLPDANNWIAQVSDHAGAPVDASCPSDPADQGVSYAMPMGLSGADLTTVPNPAEQVMVFDADGWFLAPRHERAANVGYLDGRVELVSGAHP